MSAHLLPCPFCGGPARHLPFKAGFYAEAAICDACDVSMKSAAWNRRTALASQGLAVPAVKEPAQTVASVCGVDYVMVRRDAVEWLKKYNPAICLKSGLCERIGDRLYTKTCGGWNSAAPQPPAVKEAEPAPAEIENAATVGQWRAAVDQAEPCGICDDTRVAFGKRCVCAGALAGQGFAYIKGAPT